jgi:hypothetical protein
LIDGKEVENVFISKEKLGKHTIELFLDNNKTESRINIVENHFAPSTLLVEIKDKMLSWEKIEGVVYYKIFQNGNKIAEIKEAVFPIKAENITDEYTVVAVDKDGFESFMSEPVIFSNEKYFEVEPSNCPFETTIEGYTGKGYVKTTKDKNDNIVFEKETEHEGYYWIDFKYANGNGPINTFNACAMRTLFVDDELTSTIVLPQRGDNVWNSWGYTNSVKCYLKKGVSKISLKYCPVNNNMNGEINEALIDNLRLTPVN